MVLGQRLSCESLRLLCLHIILAIYRARREKMSYSALLASRQSWESWPQVVSPCGAERVNLWLQNEDKGEEGREDFEALQQMTELQLLVLTQEEERKHLLKLVHGIALEDLQESGRTISAKDSGGVDADQTSLRAGCIKRLKQIQARLQRQNGSEDSSEQTRIQIEMQENWSQPVVADCTLQLLTRLTELQEVQALALLQVLQHRDSQAAHALRERYEAELKTQCFTNLLHLLNPDDPCQTPGSLLAENAGSEQIGPELSCTAEVENICERSVPAAAADLINRAGGESVEARTADGSVQQEVCSGCGAVMEELPYLEILCVPEAQAQAAAPEAGACREEDSSETKSLESFEKQGSLIPLAWSKPPEEDADYSAEDEAEEADQYQDFPRSTAIQVQSTQCEETAQPIPEQSRAGEAASEKDPSSLEEDLLDPRPHVSSNSFEQSADGGSNPTPSASREMTESELWDLRGSELSGPEDLIRSQESTQIDSSLSGRTTTLETNQLEREEIIREQAVERERTMRNLVDMQRRFEERHQRDKERQRFRVQERLSIIQNRKAEEDLLGLKHTDRLKHLTQDLPLEDKAQQKTVVRERLEQLRRERSYIMQSKRDRNTAGFKELLAPVALHNNEAEDGAN
ncbi:uncharacterized protein LOC110369234 [Fundulus heteroclitus]|uniref:uncharacterized protein LOC110369234 n=1 Tax=Fundulus heteroclitus TaxID=8078 RepID=UPI00165C2348|nr:uncharacterized protein LOC110369234 [Fundulus heteroclitus]